MSSGIPREALPPPDALRAVHFYPKALVHPPARPWGLHFLAPGRLRVDWGGESRDWTFTAEAVRVGPLCIHGAYWLRLKCGDEARVEMFAWDGPTRARTTALDPLGQGKALLLCRFDG